MLQRRIGMHILSVSTAALLFGSTAFAQSQGDKNFVKAAMQVNVGEMRIGQLAAKKGATEGVRSFGERTVIDHTRLEKRSSQLPRKSECPSPRGLPRTIRRC